MFRFLKKSVPIKELDAVDQGPGDVDPVFTPLESRRFGR
jgi:hypothetical protein